MQISDGRFMVEWNTTGPRNLKITREYDNVVIYEELEDDALYVRTDESAETMLHEVGNR